MEVPFPVTFGQCTKAEAATNKDASSSLTLAVVSKLCCRGFLELLPTYFRPVSDTHLFSGFAQVSKPAKPK